MQQQQQGPHKLTLAETFNIVYLIFATHRLCILLFMRHSFGGGALAASLLSFFLMLFLSANYPGFGWYAAAWLVLLVVHRFTSIRDFWLGKAGHSYYTGYPWLAMHWPGVKSEGQARKAEPFICLFGGIFLATLAPHVGLFVMGGFISFAACMAIDELVDRTRLQELRDSEIQMRYYADRFRRGL